MKPLFKFTSLFLSFLIAIQSCAVYTGNYTLDQAVNEKRKAKITTVDESVFVFEKIDTLNGEFVGVKYKRNQPQNMTLDEAQVNQVQLIEEDRTKQNNRRLIGTAAGLALGVIFGVILFSNIKTTIPDFTDQK